MRPKQCCRLGGILLACLFILVTWVLPVQANRVVLAAHSESLSAQGASIDFRGQVFPPSPSTSDLRSLPSGPSGETLLSQPVPLKHTPNDPVKAPAEALANWQDPLAQTTNAAGSMPAVISTWEGMYFQNGGTGIPPDADGDVGPNHYIQVVNTSIAIYDKHSHNLLKQVHYNDFFKNTNTQCDTDNAGDPVVVYDRFEDRWLITDFSIAGPFYECLAISKTPDPLGNWKFYALKISDTEVNDYPKLGVWRDAYFLTFNMFDNLTMTGVQVWALNKADLLADSLIPVRTVSTTLPISLGYASLLPAHALSQPPAGAPGYFVSVGYPNSVYLWKFRPDFNTPARSQFSGPVTLEVAPFAIAATVPQPDAPGQDNPHLDSISPRPMMQLIYRQVGAVESLWFNHTVSSQGSAAVRWYELRGLSSLPIVYQQGSFQPDGAHRWMGSLAVDRDGNMAVGYSVSSDTVFPSIRVAGRLEGETLGLLPQGEMEFYTGSGSQLSFYRWGDYSAMAVDPADDCTFYYTNEYLAYTGITWRTRIGSFKFPSCGQPKGTLSGVVRDFASHAPLPAVPVQAVSGALSYSVQTGADGSYQMQLPAGTYTLTAGPLPPGYPVAGEMANLSLSAGTALSQDVRLAPVPHLVQANLQVLDPAPFGNDNAASEPGEWKMNLHLEVKNDGAATATNVHARLHSLLSGVDLVEPEAAYPDLASGQSGSASFAISLSRDLPCGDSADLLLVLTTDQGNFSVPVRLDFAALQPPEIAFSNDVESDQKDWTTTSNNGVEWGVVSSTFHSPAHSWTDSPGGTYTNTTDSALISPVVDLSGRRAVRLTGWVRYSLEAGYDFVRLEISTDGGVSWKPGPLPEWTGEQSAWKQFIADLPSLDGQSQAAVRFHLLTDPGVIADGFYIDDLTLSYEPYTCAPALIAPFHETRLSDVPNLVTFAWTSGGGTFSPEGYRLLLDGSPILTTTALTATMPIGDGAHTWSVQSFSAGGLKESSPEWGLTAAPVATETAPASPVSLWPPDRLQSASRLVYFAWSPAASGGTPSSYELWVDGLLSLTTGKLSVQLELSPGRHSWYLIAKNTKGSATAETRSLTIFSRMFFPFLTRK